MIYQEMSVLLTHSAVMHVLFLSRLHGWLKGHAQLAAKEYTSAVSTFRNMEKKVSACYSIVKPVRKVMCYLMMHSAHFIYLYMVLNIC